MSRVLALVWTVMTSSAIAGQERPMLRRGDMLIAASSLERSEDSGSGLRAHTNHLILATPEMDAAPEGTAAFVGAKPSGEAPASVRSAYKTPATGGAGATRHSRRR